MPSNFNPPAAVKREIHTVQNQASSATMLDFDTWFNGA
jgi:hypothetical protein